MSLTLFCSRGNVEDLIGVDEVAMRLDDNRDGIPEVNITPILEQGTLDVLRLVQPKHSISDLVVLGIPLDSARLYATVASARRLDSRRGNPASDELTAWWNEMAEELKLIGSPLSPLFMAGYVGSKHNAPSVVNHGIDFRARTAIVRKQMAISNEPTTTLREYKEQDYYTTPGYE